MQKLIKSKELAVLLGLRVDTVLRWARQGILPRLKLSRNVIRFDAEEVQKAIREKNIVNGSQKS